MKIIILITCFFVLFSINISWAVKADKNTALAVADFSGQNVSTVDAVTVTDFFRSELVNLKYFKVLERKNMEMILGEQQFQLTGCTDQECAVKMGKLLNVEKIIVGKVTRFEPYYYISAQIIDVETGEILVSERIRCRKRAELPDKASYFAHFISEVLTGKKSPTSRTSAKKNNILLGIGLGRQDMESILLNQNCIRISGEYRFNKNISAEFSCNATIIDNNTLYLSENMFGIEYEEGIKSLTIFSLDLKCNIPLFRRYCLTAFSGPTYYKVNSIQQLGPSIPTPVNNYGTGTSLGGGISYFITQSLSINVLATYQYGSINRVIDYAGLQVNRKRYEPYFKDLETDYNLSGLTYWIGINIEFSSRSLTYDF